jgi:AcrR family transcriptional regulator
MRSRSYAAHGGGAQWITNLACFQTLQPTVLPTWLVTSASVTTRRLRKVRFTHLSLHCTKAGASITLPRPKLKTPRKPLTRERIERAALDLIERAGLQSFSTRKLAEVLGCEAMSIYHHFPSKAHLMDALLDRVIGGLPPPPTKGTLLQKLGRMAHDFRDMALAYPKFFQFVVIHRMNTPTALAFLNGILGVFREGGFDDETRARLFRSLSYYLMGALLDETAGYAKGPSAAVPVPLDVQRRNYPEISAVGPYFQGQHHKKIFDAGLEILLEGIRKEAEHAAMR